MKLAAKLVPIVFAVVACSPASMPPPSRTPAATTGIVASGTMMDLSPSAPLLWLAADQPRMVAMPDSGSVSMDLAETRPLSADYAEIDSPSLVLTFGTPSSSSAAQNGIEPAAVVRLRAGGVTAAFPSEATGRIWTLIAPGKIAGTAWCRFVFATQPRDDGGLVFRFDFDCRAGPIPSEFQGSALFNLSPSDLPAPIGAISALSLRSETPVAVDLYPVLTPATDQETHGR